MRCLTGAACTRRDCDDESDPYSEITFHSEEKHVGCKVEPELLADAIASCSEHGIECFGYGFSLTAMASVECDAFAILLDPRVLEMQ